MGNRFFRFTRSGVVGIRASGVAATVSVVNVENAQWDQIVFDGGAEGLANNANGVATSGTFGFTNLQCGTLTMRNLVFGCVLANTGVNSTNFASITLDQVVIGLDTAGSMYVGAYTGEAAPHGVDFPIITLQAPTTDIWIDHVDILENVGSTTIYAELGGKLHIGGGQIRRTANHSEKLISAKNGAVITLRDFTTENKWSTASTLDATSSLALQGACDVQTTINGPTNRSTVQLTGAVAVNVSYPAITANSQVRITLLAVGGTQGKTPAITISSGVGFAIVGEALDTSTYQYEVI
jgi:hypothetical protein